MKKYVNGVIDALLLLFLGILTFPTFAQENPVTEQAFTFDKVYELVLLLMLGALIVAVLWIASRGQEHLKNLVSPEVAKEFLKMGLEFAHDEARKAQELAKLTATPLDDMLATLAEKVSAQILVQLEQGSALPKDPPASTQ